MRSGRKIVQIKKTHNFELFPDKAFFLSVLKIIIQEIKKSNQSMLRKKKR